MAESLGELLKRKQSQLQTSQDLGLGTAAGVQQILAAKSGKAVGPSTGPAASSLAEQQAVANTGTQLQQVAKEGALKGLQQEVQGEEQQQAADINQQQLQLKTDSFRKGAARDFTRLMQERAQANRAMDFDKRKAVDEQIGFNERLGTEKYVFNLQQAGQRARLDSDIEFRNQLQEDYYSGMEDLLKNDLKFKSLLNAKDREFNEKLAQMDISTAMAILSGNIRAANTGAIYGGVGSAVSGGIAAWDKYGKKAQPESNLEDADIAEDYGA